MGKICRKECFNPGMKEWGWWMMRRQIHGLTPSNLNSFKNILQADFVYWVKWLLTIPPKIDIRTDRMLTCLCAQGTKHRLGARWRRLISTMDFSVAEAMRPVAAHYCSNCTVCIGCVCQRSNKASGCRSLAEKDHAAAWLRKAVSAACCLQS